MSKIRYIISILIIVTACNNNDIAFHLGEISEIANDNPDSALVLLANLKKEKRHWNKDDNMRYELVKMKSQNKAGMQLVSDSSITSVVAYFTDKGSQNEKMLAYYLQGRIQSNRGEIPQAIQTYYKAIEEADTTDANCDFNTLAAIYGQMSQIYHLQYLPEDEIGALSHYCEYIRKSRSEEDYIAAQCQMIRPYYLLGKDDSVLSIINTSYDKLSRIGRTTRAARLLPPAIYINIKRNKLKEAERLINIFENESALFDSVGNIAAGREHYYATKGFYALAIKDYDHAEQLFRRAIHYGYISDGYKGLLDVYQHKCFLDSISLFAKLYEKAQDSLHLQLQTEATLRMSALYDYTRSQEKAEAEARKARQARYVTYCVVVCSFIIIIVLSLIYRRYKRKQQLEIEKVDSALASAQKEYSTVQEELTKLKSQDYQSLIVEKENKIKELKLIIDNVSGSDSISDITDSIETFEKSKIASVFKQRENSKSNHAIPTKNEWKTLEEQFCKHMPTAHKTLVKEKKLSQLELRVCILIILGFEDYSIVNLTESMPQTVSTAKARANKKLFNEKGAQTLRYNLTQMIKSH